MKRLIVASFLLFAVAGCQAASKSGSEADAVAADAPKLIDQLTDQALVYECPDCQMDYDRAGQCSMCKVDLVATQVRYVCPVDDQPVERAGKCPRCDAEAKVIKTALAEPSEHAGERHQGP